MIKIKRAYEAAEKSDGMRFLVDRLWPRGIKKEDLKVEEWDKEVAPSNDLRKRFHHDPEKWDEFCRHYFEELDKKPESWQGILEAAKEGTVTLIYGAKDLEHNNARALKEYLEKKL
ncbi:MAG: DUF488 domain-containing protein [Calditrichia bacterium]